MKNNKILRIFIFTMLIVTITINSYPRKVYAAGGSVKAYLMQKAKEEAEEIVIKEVATQAGYKVASQAEIDAMRATFDKKIGDYVTPIDFGDFTWANTEEKQKLDEWQKQHNPNYVSDEDWRNRVDTYISTNVSEPTRKVIDEIIQEQQKQWTPFKLPENQTSTDIPNKKFDFSTNITGVKLSVTTTITVTRTITLPTGTTSIDFYYHISSHTNTWNDGTTHISYQTSLYLQPNVSGSSAIQVTTWSGVDIINTPTYDVLTTYVRQMDTSTNPYKDYLPYPHTGSELGNKKVPTKISIPVKIGEDGNPDIVSTPTYPTVKTPPIGDTTGRDIAVTPDSTIDYTKPDVDPNTDTIVDTLPDTSTDPNTDPQTDPATGLPSTNVPNNATPKLDFTPLEVATRKFPFSIPWDLMDMVKTLNASPVCPKFKFDDMPVNSSFIIPGFEFDLSTIPGIDTIAKITRYFELAYFLVFLMIKSRDIIRG